MDLMKNKTLTDWKYLVDEDSDDYKFRVVSQFDYESARERFNYDLFLKLIKKEKSLTEVFVKSCNAEDELTYALETGDDDDCPDMYSYINDFVYSEFLPKINNNFSYIPLSCYYNNTQSEGKKWFNKLDLLTIKSTKENFIIKSGWIDGTKFYSDVIKKIGNKINKKNLIDKTLKLMENISPGVVGLSGEFNWNIKKVFTTFDCSYPYDSIDPDNIAENAFIFVTKNRSDYDCCRSVFGYGYTNIWQEPLIHKKKSEELIKIMKKKFKEHYWYNCLKKKWEKCNIFKTRK